MIDTQIRPLSDSDAFIASITPSDVRDGSKLRAITEPFSEQVRLDLAELAPFLPRGSLGGLDVCHLQCHLGTDTIPLARSGAARVIRDIHPMHSAMDEEAADLRLSYRYFGDGTAQEWHDEVTYGGEGKVGSPRCFEWPAKDRDKVPCDFAIVARRPSV